MAKDGARMFWDNHGQADAPARLLVVDDDPPFVHALSQFLHGEGYLVDTAANGAQARALLANTRYHLVFTGLSRTNGLMLLGMIPQRHPDVAVLVITDYGMLARAVAAVRMGAFAYLIKPLIDDEIRVTIKKALEQQKLLSGNHRLRRQLAAVRPGYPMRRPPVRMCNWKAQGDGIP
jgi:DNA-binding NtrC family response regulator